MLLIEGLALIAIVLTGVYLLGLGAASLVAPARASRFLLGIASSVTIHFVELSLRLLIGAALVVHAPRMYLSSAFNLFGWVLLITTACLLLIPWRWHQRFTQFAVPRLIHHIALVGLASPVIGGFILVAVVRGSAA